jgi:hypothetical protein
VSVLKAQYSNASQDYESALTTIRHILPTWISEMRPRVIWIEACWILPLFTHFHVCIVSNFSFRDLLAPSVSTIRWFVIDAIQFEQAKASQSDGGRFQTEFGCENVKVSLRVM